MKHKSRTLDQVAIAKQRAVTFVSNVLGDDDRADEIQAESLQSYAGRKGILIVNNPSSQRLPAKDKKANTMAVNTKAELESMLDQIGNLAADALDPTTTRKEAIEALQAIYDIAGPDDDEDSDDDLEEDDDDDDQ